MKSQDILCGFMLYSQTWDSKVALASLLTVQNRTCFFLLTFLVSKGISGRHLLLTEGWFARKVNILVTFP